MFEFLQSFFREIAEVHLGVKTIWRVFPLYLATVRNSRLPSNNGVRFGISEQKCQKTAAYLEKISRGEFPEKM